MNFSKILVAIEGPPLAYKVMDVVYSLYKTFKSKVAIIHCIDIPYSLTGIDAGVLPEELEKVELEKTNKMLDDVIGKYDFDLKDIEKIIVRGVPEEEVINVSDKWQPDLMIVGTHSRTGISKFFLGSIKEKIVQKAKKPILIVPIDS